MKTFIYELADNFLHLSKIEEGNGDGLLLVFPKHLKGTCRLADESAPLQNGYARFAEKKRARGTYRLRLHTEQGELCADSLCFCDGQWRCESDMEMCRVHLEIARLKDRSRELSGEIEKLNEAVFRTVIF